MPEEIKKQDSIARNTTYYTSALIIQKVLAFVYFSLIARFLGTEDTGKYVFALSFTTLFAIFIDLGLASVLAREIAKHKEKTQNYLSNVIALKIPLAIITYICVAVMINILGYPALTKNLVYLSGVIMFLDSFSMTFWAVMRGHQKLKYESLGIIGLQFITVGLGGLVLYFHLGLEFLMLALMTGSLFNLIFATIKMSRYLKIKIIPHYEPVVLKALFAIGIPFALAGIFSRVYSSLDTVLLSVLRGDAEVGWYSIPTRVTGALQFLPMAFMAALFPAMSEYFVTDKEKLKKTFEKAMHYLMIISLPLAAGVIILAEPVVLKIYTENYYNSISPLKILMVGLFFLFINYPVGYLLNAGNRQVTNTINSGVTVLVSVVMNIVLIPKYGYIGAAISSLASTFILFILGMYWVPKIIHFDQWYLIKSFIKTLTASAIMAGVIYFLMPVVSVWVLIPVGMVVYFCSLLVFGGITKQDFWDIWNSVIKG
ncbi:flippase [Candidatus Kuenenbacteria bacterium]|nr:flippase [Candidatus Kuenenbacteria bacterium]